MCDYSFTMGFPADSRKEIYMYKKKCGSELARKLDAEVEKSRHNEMWRRQQIRSIRSGCLLNWE